MISYAEALARLKEVDPILESERLPIDHCLHRSLAKEVAAVVASPHFTNSAMDGFGFRYRDVTDEGLRITETIFAGPCDALPSFTEGSCVKVMTGAPIPDWVDTVVPVERVKVEGGRAIPQAQVTQGSNIRHQAEDISRGQTLLRAGQPLTPETLSAATHCGIDRLPVVRLPRRLLISSGNELVDPPQPLQPGTIYNSSRTFLEQACRDIGWSGDSTQVPDQPEVLEAVLEEFLGDPSPSVIVTTGAVSAGDRDFIPTTAAKLGFEPSFHRVAIRPGKPIFFARRGSASWIGLPGNPVSTMVGWHFFVRPFLSHIAQVPGPVRLRARLADSVKKPKALRCFYRGTLNFEQDGPQFHVHNRQGSAHLLATAQSNAYIELIENTEQVTAGTPADVILI